MENIFSRSLTPLGTNILRKVVQIEYDQARERLSLMTSCGFLRPNNDRGDSCPVIEEVSPEELMLIINGLNTLHVQRSFMPTKDRQIDRGIAIYVLTDESPAHKC